MTRIARTTHTWGQDGAESEHTRLRVSFADGTEWSASPAAAYRPLAEFLTRKTGKPVAQARHAEDVKDK